MQCKYLETNWIREMTDALAVLHPDLSREEIEEFVIEEYHENYTDHECSLFNNYENTVVDTTLGYIVDWAEREKPLIAESGVFFYPRDKKRNVNTEIIRECMLDARTIHKAEMFAALDAGDTFTASVKDIQQNNDKKAANSGYGAEGQASSFLFNIHSAMSVTSCGRGQLSTAMLCFENLFADFVKFFDMDEFFTYMNHIIREESQWNFNVSDIIQYIPSKEEWVGRFESKFLHPSMFDHNMIELFYDGLDEDMRVRTFYKANLRAFLSKNSVPAIIFDRIVSRKTGKDFINPNEPPEEIRIDLEMLTALVMEFVGYRYSYFRYEDRARYQKHAVVIVSDTDSNMLNYGPILEFTQRFVLPVRWGLNAEEQQMYDLKCLNVFSTFASSGIAATLWNYLSYVNVAEEDRKFIKMKNEFFYEKLIVTFAKKSYIALMSRKENHFYPKPKLDVKGVNFFKSTASKETSDFIYKEVLMGQLMRPKDGKINLSRVYRTIHNFKKNISHEIKNGNMGFLKRSIKVKSPDAYSNPYRVSQSKAVFVWNSIVPDKDQIKLPDTVTIVKVKLQNKKDAAELAPWPDIYERVIHLFETDENIGDHYEFIDGKDKLVKGKGISAIALPNSYDEVPDWVLAIIDVDTLVSDNMSLFDQLFKPLGMTEGSVTHRGEQLKYFTSIVRI